jgi:hypothetical protein
MFFVGYILGQLRSLSGVSPIQKQRKISNFFDKDQAQSISIDSTKVVTKIETDGLEKKYSKLGDIKQSEDNISSSVNKLKNMKG